MRDLLMMAFGAASVAAGIVSALVIGRWQRRRETARAVARVESYLRNRDRFFAVYDPGDRGDG